MDLTIVVDQPICCCGFFWFFTMKMCMSCLSTCQVVETDFEGFGWQVMFNPLHSLNAK
jgi:hypothetical protein